MQKQFSSLEIERMMDKFKNEEEESEKILRQRIRENMQDYKMLHIPFNNKEEENEYSEFSDIIHLENEARDREEAVRLGQIWPRISSSNYPYRYNDTEFIQRVEDNKLSRQKFGEEKYQKYLKGFQGKRK